MAILLPHLIAPVDCRRWFSWVLSKKRVVDNSSLRVKRPNSLEFASLIFTFAPKNVPIYYKLFLCATVTNFIPTFCWNFHEFSCALYNYRIPSKNYCKKLYSRILSLICSGKLLATTVASFVKWEFQSTM